MKKRNGKWNVFALLLCLFILAGCGKGAGNADDAQNGTQDQSGVQDETQGDVPNETEGTDAAADAEPAVYTVTFYDNDGTTVLSTQEVADGALAEEYTPKKDGLIFMGWFGTPSHTHTFDFSAPITADVGVYAGFMEYVEDTRTFAIVGSGTSPLLSASSWGKVINEEHYLTKSADENLYTITLDLCAGDEFQFAIDSSWANQRGGGYMTTTEADGTEYFTVSGGLSDSTLKANIKCAVSGNYTLMLHTYPGADVYDTGASTYSEETREIYNSNPYDRIEWTYNGEMAGGEQEAVTTYYIKGAVITNWEDRYDEMYGFKEENGIHTLTIDLEEGDEFLLTTLVTVGENSGVGNEYVRYTNITDEASLALVDGTENANIIVKQTGTYTLTYDPASGELTVALEQ
ncbi:MAG: InlB B-repeat-containing protein [Clostridium sp.]|nr:InlB B-repeat-containing protein [Clostridium sp.]